MRRTGCIAALALLAGFGLSADGQTPATTPQAATQKPDKPVIEQPADFKAFNEASKTSDPKKRIEALQKFLTDYPGSDLASNAAGEIRSQYLRSAADSTKQYLSEAEKFEKTSKSPPVLTYDLLATELLRDGILLDQAEGFAVKGLNAEDEAKYVQLARERATAALAERKQRPPNGGVRFTRDAGGQVTATLLPPDPAPTPPRERTDEELRAQYRSQRARLRSTLGQIYLKRGKNAEAEKVFKELYADPDVPSNAKTVAVRALADFARKAGDDKALAQYLMDSVIAGAPPGVHNELREVYRRSHNGSLDGLEAALDAMYAKALPKIDVKPFERTKIKEPRVVLAELFTGAECPPCVGIDLAFEAALERFKPEDLALLVYHEHIPGPDPMTNPSTEKRREFYNVRGVPTHYINGKTDGAGGGGADSTERFFTTRIRPDIELGMGVRPEATLDLKAATSGSTIRVKASVTNVASKSDRLRLQIVLAEERLRYQGGNGVRFHPMVVRSIATVPPKAAAAKQAGATGASPASEQGFAIPPGKGLKVDYVFDLKRIADENRKFIDDFLAKPFRGGDKPAFSARMDDIDPRHLVIVAFVQDEDPKQGTGEAVTTVVTTSHPDARLATVSNQTMQGGAVPLRHVLQAAVVRLGAASTN